MGGFSTVRGLAAVCLLGCVTGVLHADTASATLTIDQSTQVPGATLKPGTYTIGVVDSLADRMVIHIDGEAGKTHLVFLAVPKPAFGASGMHPVEWTTADSKKHSLRGFNFGSQFAEFVYPKNEAVALANANNTGVVAIDPKSEGRPELNKLTSQDREMVSLWMLSPVQVSPTEKGISAKHYVGDPSATQVASTPESSTGSGAVAPNQGTAPAPVKAPAPTSTQVAALHTPPAPKAYRPAIKRLPQTASQMPIVWLVGGFCILGAVSLRTRREFNS